MSATQKGSVATKPRRASSVYVLPIFRNGRSIAEPANRAAYSLLVEFQDTLPPDLARGFAALQAQEDRASQRDRQWATEFLQACAEDGRNGWPDGAGRTVWHQSQMSLKMLALGRLWRVRAAGATAPEIQRYYDIVSGGIPGALAGLHKSGVVARLEEKR